MSALSSEPAATVEVAMEFKLKLPSENHCQTQWINGSYVREGCAVEKTAARCEGIHIAPESVCEFKWKPFAEQPGAKAEYCPDTVTYNNAYNFSGLGHKVCSNLLITPPVSGEVKIGKCTQDFEDGRWHVHRVGPFTTTGGFSWTQLDFWDVGDFEALLKERPRLSVARVFNGPVDATLGQRMKLHEHHTHLNWGYQQVRYSDRPRVTRTTRPRAARPGTRKAQSCYCQKPRRLLSRSVSRAGVLHPTLSSRGVGLLQSQPRHLPGEEALTAGLRPSRRECEVSPTRQSRRPLP